MSYLLPSIAHTQIGLYEEESQNKLYLTFAVNDLFYSLFILFLLYWQVTHCIHIYIQILLTNYKYTKPTLCLSVNLVFNIERFFNEENIHTYITY